jgi:hypothetical protein
MFVAAYLVAPVLLFGLGCVMMQLAQRLPIRRLPEQPHASSVWYYMVHYRCRCGSTLPGTHPTYRILCQEHAARTLPPGGIV